MFKRQLPTRHKLLLLSLLIGLCSIVFTGRMAIRHSSDALLQQRRQSLLAICKSRRERIEDYFATARGQLREYARSTMINQATADFVDAFDLLPEELPSLDGSGAEMERALNDYYQQTLDAGDTSSSLDVGAAVAALSPQARCAKWLLLNGDLANTKSSSLRSEEATNCRYQRLHTELHPILRKYAKTFGYSDIILTSQSGDVVYSVEKQLDFGTNLLHGSFSNTGLSTAFRAALKNHPGTVHFVDFSNYGYPVGQSSGFLSTQVLRKGELVGTLIFRLSLQRIHSIVQRADGLGITGETYLVGADGMLRCGGRLTQAAGSTPGLIENDAVVNGLEGKSGTVMQTNGVGRRVLAAFAPLQVDGLDWCIVSEIDEAELLDPALQLRGSLSWAALGSAILVAVLAFLCTSLVVHKQYENELLLSARVDKLTGLANRELLQSRLQKAIANYQADPQATFAVLFLDFDRFKTVNDSLGHIVGDLLLKEIAVRLRLAVDSIHSIEQDVCGTTISRIGGDEFVVLVDTGPGKPSAEEVADSLLLTLNRTYRLDIHEVNSTASIGMTKCSPEYVTAEDMLRDADTAMYEAKLRGRARAVVFDRSMQEAIRSRIQFERDISYALENQQFELAYQPIFNLTTGHLASAEALIRWKHPERGQVPPNEFIPICEELGLVIPISEWVFEEACRSKARWKSLYGKFAPQTMSVNLSQKHFASGDLETTIRSILAQTQLQPHELQMEITETAVMTDVAASKKILKALKEIGVSLALDDFGTGHSTLAMLRDFPIDLVKIDRTFTYRTNDSKQMAALVHAVAVLARNLGLETVAEGIETPEDLLALQSVGCNYGQGYYLGAPMSDVAFEQYLCKRATALEVEGAVIFAGGNQEELTIIPIAGSQV